MQHLVKSRKSRWKEFSSQVKSETWKKARKAKKGEMIASAEKEKSFASIFALLINLVVFYLGFNTLWKHNK